MKYINLSKIITPTVINYLNEMASFKNLNDMVIPKNWTNSWTDLLAIRCKGDISNPKWVNLSPIQLRNWSRGNDNIDGITQLIIGCIFALKYSGYTECPEDYDDAINHNIWVNAWEKLEENGIPFETIEQLWSKLGNLNVYKQKNKLINQQPVKQSNEWEPWQKYITYNNLNTEYDEYAIQDIVSTYYDNLISAVLKTLNKNGYQSEKESENDTFESTYGLDVKNNIDFYDVCFCINGAREGGGRMLLPEAIFGYVQISNQFDMMFSEHLSPVVSLGVSYPCATELVYNIYRDKWLIKNTGWSGNQNVVECYYNYFSAEND